MTHALCLAYVARTSQQHHASPLTRMQAVMHQGDAGQLGSLVSRLEGMGGEISHHQKKQHGLINASNCSDFPDGNCFCSFGGKKGKLFLPCSLSPNYITSAQKRNVLGHLISGSWTYRYFCAAGPIPLSSVQCSPLYTSYRVAQ